MHRYSREGSVSRLWHWQQWVGVAALHPSRAEHDHAVSRVVAGTSAQCAPDGCSTDLEPAWGLTYP